MTIPDEVERAAREPTDAELADDLRTIAGELCDEYGPKLRLAAQRLEARGEISEAMVRRAAETFCNEIRRSYGMPPLPWSDSGFDGIRDTYESRMRVALEAALSGKEE